MGPTESGPGDEAAGEHQRDRERRHEADRDRAAGGQARGEGVARRAAQLLNGAAAMPSVGTAGP
jgi:hypothetical protein